METVKRLAYATRPMWEVLALAAAIVMGMRAQGTGPLTPVIPTPNCQINFQFTATGTSPQFPGTTPDAFDNRNLGCTAWAIVYSNSGFSAISIVAQTAPNVAGVPGSWSTYTPTTSGGSNPNTSTTSAATLFGSGTNYFPWIRVNLTTATGSGIVQGTMYGWKTQPVAVYFGGGGGGTINSVVWGPDASGSPPTEPPILTAGIDGTNVQTIKTDTSGRQLVVGAAAAGAAVAGNPVLFGASDGTNVQTAIYCNQRAAVTLAAGTNVIIVVAAVGKTTKICHLDFTMDSVQTILIRQGTGATCGSTTTNLSGTYQSALGLAGLFEDYGPWSPLANTIANVDTCLQFGGSVTVGGTVIYGQF